MQSRQEGLATRPRWPAIVSVLVGGTFLAACTMAPAPGPTTVPKPTQLTTTASPAAANTPAALISPSPESVASSPPGPSPSPSPSPAAAVRLVDLFAELRTFAGVALLPSPNLEPFSALEPWRIEMNRPRAGSTAVVRGRYLVQYRDPHGGTESAQIGGAMGREELDQTLLTLAGRSFRRCPADAPYCVENVGGQDGAMPASEVFRGLAVHDGPAVAEHVVCCGGHYWSLSWYDTARDMTYTLILVGPVADQYGSGIAAENERAAQTIAGIAGRLQPLD